jgi:hypothetical protein
MPKRRILGYSLITLILFSTSIYIGRVLIASHGIYPLLAYLIFPLTLVAIAGLSYLLAWCFN